MFIRLKGAAAILSHAAMRLRMLDEPHNASVVEAEASACREVIRNIEHPET